jgi:hypothetical protein
LRRIEGQNFELRLRFPATPSICDCRRNGYPKLRTLLDAFPRRRAVLDGEIVALDRRGRPSFSLLQQARVCLITRPGLRRGQVAPGVASHLAEL